MSKNASITMLVIFLIAGAVFFGIFWQMESGSGDELQKNLEKNSATALTAPAVQSAKPTSASADATMAMPSAEQANTQKDPATSSEAVNSVTKDDTADWKTYKDDKNSFEFKYPSDVSVSTDGDMIKVAQKDAFWRMRLYDDTTGLDLQGWYLDYFSEKERRNCTLSDTSTIKVGTYETKYANPNFGNALCVRDGYFSIDESKKTVVRIFPDKETTDNINKILATVKLNKMRYILDTPMLK